MDQNLIAEILTGDSDEIEDLKANLPVLEGFIQMARELDDLPEVTKRFYEDSRSLYQATSTDRHISDLETLLAKFFGPPVKPAGKPLPRKLRKNSSVKYLGGVEKDQSLFLIQLKTGEFYGALWPWRRNKAKIEIHLGYCSDWMVDAHYQQLETLVKRSLSRSAFAQMDISVGGEIRGIGLPSFLQMAEMERSSFMLRVKSSGRAGKLHVSDGVLIDAETVDRTGRDAAYRIIAWDDVVIEIAQPDTSKTDEIKQPLMHVLMESLKIKDEITSSFEAEPPPLPEAKQKKAHPPKAERGKRLVRLERAPTPQMPRRGLKFSKLFAIIVAVLVVGGSTLVIGLQILNNRAMSDQFDMLREQVERVDPLEKKLEMWEKYLLTSPNSPRKSDALAEIEKVRNQMEDRDFEQMVYKISILPVDENYEQKAISLYSEFLEKYPDSRYQQRINDSIADIKKLLDQYYYEELKQAARLNFSNRMKVYREYLNRYPDGSYRRDVQVLINEMGRQHLKYLKELDEECEKNRRWKPCIERYEAFTREFEGTELAGEAKAMIKALEDRKDLINLRRAKVQAGMDIQKAYLAYRNYLDSHPDTTQREVIKEELDQLKAKLDTQKHWDTVRAYATNDRHGLYERIQKLDQYLGANKSSPYAAEAQALMDRLEVQRKIALRQNRLQAQQQEEQARIQREKQRRAEMKRLARQTRSELEQQLAGSSRFKSNGDGTVTDLNTGLTWTILDSYQELGGCFDYEAARQYVRNITTGGHRDWRLPTASELATIYKQHPFFPGGGADWYWTSEQFARGYHTVVSVITSTPETVFNREYRNISECGAVRAVRP